MTSITNTSTVQDLEPRDVLLWEAMEALNACIRILNNYSDATNYGDACVVSVKIEEHFGFNKR